jgi:YaiO family outer membrane protein
MCWRSALLAAALIVFGVGAALAQDAGELQRSGHEARLAGRFGEAATLLGEAARLRPDDADAQVELGLALTPLKRFDEAEAALRRALALAPDYVDAKLGLARLAFFRGRFAEARSGITEVIGVRPQDEDARALLAQIDRAIAGRLAERRAAERRAARARAARAAAAAAAAATTVAAAAAIPLRQWRLDLDGSWSALTGGRQDWEEASGRLAYTPAPGTAIAAAVEAARRFGIVDTYLEARLDHQAADWLATHVFLGGTPAAHFRPQFAMESGFAARLYQQRGVLAAGVVTLDGRIARYVSGPVRTVTPGLEQYLFDGRLWVTAKWIHTIDELDRYRQGYLIRGDILLRDDLRAFVGYADAPENSDGTTVETRSLFGGLSFDVSDAITLRASASAEQRPGLFRRTTLSIGATARF